MVPFIFFIFGEFNIEFIYWSLWHWIPAFQAFNSFTFRSSFEKRISDVTKICPKTVTVFRRREVARNSPTAAFDQRFGIAFILICLMFENSIPPPGPLPPRFGVIPSSRLGSAVIIIAGFPAESIAVVERTVKLSGGPAFVSTSQRFPVLSFPCSFGICCRG